MKVDDTIHDVCELIVATPIHQRDVEQVVKAIYLDADANDGNIDPNRVRASLTNEYGMTVYPRVIGAVYNSLVHKKVIAVAGWGVNEDRRGRNYGKPQRIYRWVNRDGEQTR